MHEFGKREHSNRFRVANVCIILDKNEENHAKDSLTRQSFFSEECGKKKKRKKRKKRLEKLHQLIVVKLSDTNATIIFKIVC